MKAQNVKSNIFKGLMAALMITCFAVNAGATTTAGIALQSDTSKMSHSKMSKMNKKKTGKMSKDKMGTKKTDKMGTKKMDKMGTDKMSKDKAPGKM